MDDLVQRFIESSRPELEKHLSYYSNAPDIDVALDRVTRAEQGPDGLMHKHQRRVGRDSLSAIRAPLSVAMLGRNGFESFEDLFAVVKAAISDLPGIGELTIYDTSLRLGAFFGISPSSVYLQRGALKGARNFYTRRRIGTPLPLGRSVSCVGFHPELSELSAHEIENFLCVMATRL